MMFWKTKGRTQRVQEKFSWHRWFAWHPVELGKEGSGYWVWLEWVWRRRMAGGYGGDWWFYTELHPSYWKVVWRTGILDL